MKEKIITLILFSSLIAAAGYHLSMHDSLKKSDGKSSYRAVNMESTGLRCLGHEILITDYSKQDDAADYTGSAGTQIDLYIVKQGNKELLFSENVQDFLGVDARKLDQDCPDFFVHVHGSHFNRVGAESGTTRLRFNREFLKYKFSPNEVFDLVKEGEDAQ